MSHSDPISDMLTRIRNGIQAGHTEVTVKASKICEGIARVLLEQGYIEDYDRVETDKKQDILRIKLKYGPLGEKIIRKITRSSKPSRRVYRGIDDLPQIIAGMGIAIVSTNQGVLSDQQCRQRHIGGELLCLVY